MTKEQMTALFDGLVGLKGLTGIQIHIDYLDHSVPSADPRSSVEYNFVVDGESFEHIGHSDAWLKELA